MNRHFQWSDLRGLNQLVNTATVGITDLVEAVHDTILGTPGVLGRRAPRRTRGITGLVYRSVRGVTRLVGKSLDALLHVVQPAGSPSEPRTPEGLAIVAALNGVIGDHLEASANPLAIAMCLTHAGDRVELASGTLAAAVSVPPARVVVLVHGLCMSDWQWTRSGHDHGAALARDLGCLPLYLRYNTGRHIAANGHEFATLLELMWKRWPDPKPRLAIVGHSMGGLVARSACHLATLTGHHWRQHLDTLIFLGTPHLGAPLERAGRRLDDVLELSPYIAPFRRIGAIRSAGIRDLAHGFVRDEDWHSEPDGHGRHRPDPMPLPAGIRCHAIAASRQRRPADPRARIRGDGLVPIASALGQHRDATRRLAFPDGHTRITYATSHLDLLSRMEVYEAIRGWIRDAP